MTHPHNETEARIDHVLNALRDTQPSPDLEVRIADRIAARRLTITEGRPVAASRLAVAPFFAVILNSLKDPRILFTGAPIYIVAGTALTLLLAMTTLALHHRTSPAAAQSKPIPNQPYTPPQPFTASQASEPQALGLGNIQVPQSFSLGSHRASQRAGVLTPSPSKPPTDPDAIALAETLAPSHPAPPMPLTQQERLMLAIVRSGDHEQMAALDPYKREALFRQDQAAFQKFFATPTPESKTGDTE